jgi:hydroxypyruvate reductase
MNADPRATLGAMLEYLAIDDGTVPTERLRGAATRARAAGLVVLELGLQPAAEARELVDVLAAIALQGVRMGRAAVPTLILSGGPALLRGAPAGAAEFALALVLALDEHPAIHACVSEFPIAESACSVRLAPDTLQRARGLGLHPGQALTGGAAAAFFDQLGDLMSGSTKLPEAIAGRQVLRAVLLS